jgi:hypothetical protein
MTATGVLMSPWAKKRPLLRIPDAFLDRFHGPRPVPLAARTRIEATRKAQRITFATAATSGWAEERAGGEMRASLRNDSMQVSLVAAG